MKHQSNEVIEAKAATDEGAIHQAPEGIDFTLDRDLIERHIAEGQRLRAQATAAFFKGLFGRLFRAQPKPTETAVAGQASHNAALQA